MTINGWVSSAQAQGGKLLFSGLKSYLMDKPGNVRWLSFYTTMQVSDDFLKEHPEDVKAMLRALEKATVYINEHTDTAAGIIAQKLKLDYGQVRFIMAKNHYDMTFSQHFKNSCDEMSGFMMKMGTISDSPVFEDYAAPEYLREVDNSLVW